MSKLTLVPENIDEWKKELDKQMSKLGADKFSECNTDEFWIENYEGYPPEEAVSDETECWDTETEGTDIDGNH